MLRLVTHNVEFLQKAHHHLQGQAAPKVSLRGMLDPKDVTPVD
jgi:hypothetical protein